MPLWGEADEKTYTGHVELARDVWIARHKILGENCVQKTYAPAGREDAIAFAEPRLLNDLDHDHITPLREAQFDPQRSGHVTIVMRVYGGGSVLASMTTAAHRFATDDVIEISLNIASALTYLHGKKGLVHRDIKPGNILLDLERRVGYLSDFGSAAVVDADGSAAVVGTTALYQAPEAGRSGRVGPPSDVYALGLTMFEMLNGLFPYATLDAGEVDRRINQGRRSLPDRFFAPASFAPHVPDALRQLVRRAIDVESARRPTAAELVRALRDLKCVSWRHEAGDGIDGEWSGSWPPGRRPEDRIALRVTSQLVGRGVYRGRRQLAAVYRTPTSGGWRTVGVSSVRVEPQDAAAVSAFFSAVDAHLRKRWPV